MQQEKKDQAISAVSTLLIMVFAVLLCSWIGYKLPNPPIEEEGMGVAGEVLGEIEGFGNNDNATFDNNSAAAPAASAPDESYTTGQEPTPVAKTPKQDDKPVPTTKKPEPAKTTSDNSSNNTSTESTQPTTNPNATFKGRKNGTGGEGKGTATGSGQAGSTDGTQGAQGGTGKGTGVANLPGRGLRGNLPQPSKGFKKEGTVVVRIKVDRSGNVVEVEAPQKGSKNYDSEMVQKAKQAAKTAKFNADPSATEYQYGPITSEFTLR